MEIINLPKIELHSHLDGSIDPKLIFDLAKNQGIKLITDQFDSFKKYVQAPDTCDSLKTYLERFSIPVQVMQTKDNLQKIAYNYILNLKNSNIKYAEVRFAPIQHVRTGLSIDEVIQSVLSGLKSATEETGIISNLIICGMRHLPVEKNLEVFKIASKYLGYGVVAVDLAGNEADFPPLVHKKAFDYAHSEGFQITVHAGETGSYENIITSVNDLNASRIGHGVNAINDEETINLLLEKNITLEVCPTSNIQTKAYKTYREHPFKKLLDLGVRVTLNTDNMTVSNTTLNKEYRIMKETFNLDRSDFLELYRNSIEAAFVKQDYKNKLIKLLKK
ncbi:MAG TPA: adenosine deaminase [Clostridia bacterium]|nr:adenosine deaminase [Clostridia bacterium]